MPAFSRRRDKRYRHPSLWVDFGATPFQTTNWTPTRWVVPAYGLGCEIGQAIAGMFAVIGQPGTGLFAAHIIEPAESNPAQRGAALDWLSPYGGQILRQAPSGATLYVWPVCQTRDWSFSGMALTGFQGEAEVGQVLEGRLRHPRTLAVGAFSARILRFEPLRTEIVVSFINLSSDCFALLEQAIRKQSS